MVNQDYKVFALGSLMLLMHVVLPLSHMIPAEYESTHYAVFNRHDGGIFVSENESHPELAEELPPHIENEEEHDLEELTKINFEPLKKWNVKLSGYMLSQHAAYRLTINDQLEMFPPDLVS